MKKKAPLGLKCDGWMGETEKKTGAPTGYLNTLPRETEHTTVGGVGNEGKVRDQEHHRNISETRGNFSTEEVGLDPRVKRWKGHQEN